jgi:hypothetical protein
MAQKMVMLIFCVVTPCGLLRRCQRFGEIYCLYLQETICFSKMLVSACKSTSLHMVQERDNMFLRNFGVRTKSQGCKWRHYFSPRNFGIYMQVTTASQNKISYSEFFSSCHALTTDVSSSRVSSNLIINTRTSSTH